METLNEKMLEAETNPSSDADIINEVEHLLHMYQIAIDGGIWTNYDGIFDDVQDVEYELAPEYNLRAASEAEDDIATATDETAETELRNSDETAQDIKLIFADALSYIKQKKKFAAIIIGAACAMIVLLISFSTAAISRNEPLDSDVHLDETYHVSGTENPEEHTTVSHEQDYQNAVSLVDAGKYDEAISVFETLAGYKDSTQRISECHYIIASRCLEDGNTLGALRGFSKAGNFSDAPAQAATLRKVYLNALQKNSIGISRDHTVALKSDGTVAATGNNDFYQCNVSDWMDIVSISAGDTHTIGLKSNGKVVANGAVNYNQCNVGSWNDIVSISAKRYHTVALKADGTVVATGRSDYGQCDIWYWTDIVCISTGEYHTVGLKADGTVVAVGSNSRGQCDVSEWTDIAAVYAGDNHTIGLKADGTVVAVGYNSYGQCDVSAWTDIIDIGIGNSYTVGLKADGTVITAGYQQGDLSNVTDWADIVDICVGVSHVIGLKADGSVVSVNYSSAEDSTISSWTNVKIPE